MRPIWGWSAFVLVTALSASLLLADAAREDALRRNAAAAEHVAQTELALLLEPSDLVAPINGDRAQELARDIRERITSTTPIDSVRIYSSLGRILYAEDAGIVGTRATYLRNLAFEISNGEAAVSQVHSGSLQTLVPIWLSPSGPVVVAELSQAFGPIASKATARWYLVALACGALLLGAVGMIVATSLAAPRVEYPRAFVGGRRTSPHRASVSATPWPSAGSHATGSPNGTATSPRQRKELDDALARISELERRVGSAGERDAQLQRLREHLAVTQRALAEATARDLGHDEIEIQEQGGVDELSIRRSGGRTRPGNVGSSHG